MKKLFYLFAFMAFTFTSCQQFDFEEIQTTSAKEIVNSKFNISLSDVKTLVSILDKDDSNNQLEYIEPLAYNGDTLLYIVNYKDNKGWRIISGDRRTTSVLAAAEDGVFKLKEINPGVGNWLVELADNILELKKYGKEDTTIGDYTLWRNVDKYQESLANASQAQKILSPDENNGYWELYDITCSDLPTIQVGPLLQTKWGQHKPWNTCVPNGYNTTDRCATGCVAIAGAQTLYFLHYYIGIPAYIPTVGSCVGYSNSSTDKNYNFYFSNQTSTAWDNMDTRRTYDNWIGDYLNTTGTDLAALLMGWVGMKINTDYTLNESSAQPKDLASFFNDIGINCSFKDYNSTELRQSLQNKKPVILAARRRTEPIVFLWITWGYKTSGHVFVADGYEINQTKYTYYYRWVESNGIQPMYTISQNVPIFDRIEELYKTEEYISSSNLLMMNWGYDGDYDNGRYSYDGAWNTLSDRNYAYDRQMIIGFSKK